MTAETLELVGIGRGDDDDSVREVVESFMVEAAEVHGVKEFVVVADVVFERVESVNWSKHRVKKLVDEGQDSHHGSDRLGLMDS